MKWSVDKFATFWDNPRPAMPLVKFSLTDNVHGFWPGRRFMTQGKNEYVNCLVSLVKALPDIRLTVEAYAAHDTCHFVRWLMRATGDNGPFAMTGIDQITVNDAGLVVSNHIVMDTAWFESKSGNPVPWQVSLRS